VGHYHIRGAYFHTFKTSSQIGHTWLGPQKLGWPRAPRSLNPSLYTRKCLESKSLIHAMI